MIGPILIPAIYPLAGHNLKLETYTLHATVDLTFLISPPVDTLPHF